MRIAYLANLFPTPVEPYVVAEIEALRGHGISVIPCSIRRAGALGPDLQAPGGETLYMRKAGPRLSLSALWCCVRELPKLHPFLSRVLIRGGESPGRRLRALAHTYLGVCFAGLLKNRGVQHIHVHHGYFASWIAMVAARILGIRFSMTLHGSDLLLHPTYLDLKLKECSFCVTVSEFNRNVLLRRYACPSNKVAVQRMGVCCAKTPSPRARQAPDRILKMLAVGRLHAVKNHAFLIRGCRLLKDREVPFRCEIAGEGDERRSLERLIHSLSLDGEVTLLGHLSPEQVDARYAETDLVVLTSRSEGIPLVLMEAMALAKPVLAPAITGIPELVSDGKTGFLYREGSLLDFADCVERIATSLPMLEPLCRAARQHVLQHFDRDKNLQAFCDFFIANLAKERNQECQTCA